MGDLTFWSKSIINTLCEIKEQRMRRCRSSSSSRWWRRRGQTGPPQDRQALLKEREVYIARWEPGQHAWVPTSLHRLDPRQVTTTQEPRQGYQKSILQNVLEGAIKSPLFKVSWRGLPHVHSPCRAALLKGKCVSTDAEKRFITLAWKGYCSKANPEILAAPVRAAYRLLPTEGPLWGYPRGRFWDFGTVLEPLRGHLSPKVDEIFQK